MNEAPPQNTFHELRTFLDAYNASLEMDTKDTIELTKSFLLRNPMWNPDVRALYGQAMNILGRRDLANELACVVAEVIETIAENGKKIIDIPLCYTEYDTLHRIGETVDQSAYALALQKLGTIKEKPLLCIEADTHLSNSALVPYLNDCWELITDPTDAAHLMSFAKFRPLSTFLYKYSDTQYGHSGDFFADCYTDLTRANINPSFFKLKDITIEKAMRFLKPFGLKQNDEFVVLHLREESALVGQGLQLPNAHWHSNRNVRVENFISSIDYLLAMGLKVIRIGNKNMTPIVDKKGFIDLTRVEYPGEVDIFLCGAAKFYFGSASGPYSLASQLGTKCCVTNYEAVTGTRHTDFTQFINLKVLKTGRSCTYLDIEYNNLLGVFSNQVFERCSLEVQFPTESENLQLVTEMIEYLDEGSVFILNKETQKAKEEKRIWGGICSKSLDFLKLGKD